mgnify:CR=1 FL=1
MEQAAGEGGAREGPFFGIDSEFYLDLAHAGDHVIAAPIVPFAPSVMR